MGKMRVPDLRTAQIVHDLRQPLAAMQLWLDMIGRDGDARSCASHCQRSLTRMRKLIDQLLHPPDADDVVEVALAVVVEETVKELVGLAEARSVRLELRVRAAPTIVEQPGALYRALANVLENAIRHTPAHSVVRVEVDAHPEAGEAILDVIDAGPGVPPELRETVFDPFFTTRSSGSGLGLATARSIVRAHGGEVQFVDDAGGHVRIVLPCSVASRGPASADGATIRP
ncbi:MAG: sasS [Myxococcales bacterium]|nr:sasS [Myxococcales bacterium]